MVATTTPIVPQRSIARRDHVFAAQMALGMLCINLVGFGPTLYLRPFFDVPEIPVYLYVHGAAGTAWFALFAIQSLLITKSRFGIHRRIGWAGLLVAAVVLVSGIHTSYNMVPRNAALGEVTAADIALYETVTTADLTAFVLFPGLVLSAILFRRRSDVHWRLVLLASVSILGPALARIASWLAEFPNPIPGILLLLAITTVCIHDLRTRSRVHVATAMGGGFTITLFLMMQLSGIGSAIVAAKLGQ